VRLFQASDRVARKIAVFRATYTTPTDGLARDSCNEGGNMLVVGPPVWLDFNG
jgi:hypothetical protein